MAIYYYLIILAAALMGFGIAAYIHLHKRAAKPMTCPLNSNCEAVIYSDYSRFLGWPLENWGLVYYGVVAVLYFVLIFYPSLGGWGLVGAVGLVSIFAFGFSLYLTYIQMARLKEWCVWCLTSALVSSIIFLALVGYWLTV